MFKSPYDTTAAPAYDLRGLLGNIEIAKVENTLVSGLVEGSPDVLALLTDTEVPVFPHPITVVSRVDNSVYTVVDLRPYRTQIKRVSERQVDLPNSGPVPFALMRARLQHIWNKPNCPDLYNQSTLPLAVYANWVANTVSHKLDLSGEAGAVLKVLAGLWYYCQFLPGDNEKVVLTEDTAVKVATGVNRALSIPVPMALKIIEQWGHTICTTDQFVEAAKNSGASIRLNQLNKGLFYTIIGGGWFGTTSVREVVGVAVEYPPTFLAMLWAAINERTYRNTPIGLLLQRLGKNGLDKQFERGLGLVLTTFKG